MAKTSWGIGSGPTPPPPPPNKRSVSDGIRGGSFASVRRDGSSAGPSGDGGSSGASSGGGSSGGGGFSGGGELSQGFQVWHTNPAASSGAFHSIAALCTSQTPTLLSLTNFRALLVLFRAVWRVFCWATGGGCDGRQLKPLQNCPPAAGCPRMPRPFATR
jgi:hypothetical protein